MSDPADIASGDTMDGKSRHQLARLATQARNGTITLEAVAETIDRVLAGDWARIKKAMDRVRERNPAPQFTGNAAAASAPNDEIT